MLSRLKKLNPDLSASGIAVVIAVLSVFIALGSDNAPCLSANATCTVGQNPEFTGDIDIKSDTIYNATIGHNLSANATYSLVQPGYNHTGNLAVIDSANDLNVGGAVVLGTSATSTLGAIRFDSNAVEVYDSTGAWVGVGGTPTDDIGQVTADSGSFTAATQQDNINIVGGTGISTSITSDTLTINSSGGGIDYASYKLGSDQTLSYGGSSTVLDYDTEVFDTSGCFSTSSGTITYDAGCSSAYFMIENTQTFGFSGLSSGQAIIQGEIRKNGGDEFYYTNWLTLYGSNDSVTQTWTVPFCLDPSDTVDNRLWHGVGYASGSIVVKGGGNKGGFFTITKIKDKGSSC